MKLSNKEIENIFNLCNQIIKDIIFQLKEENIALSKKLITIEEKNLITNLFIKKFQDNYSKENLMSFFNEEEKAKKFHNKLFKEWENDKIFDSNKKELNRYIKYFNEFSEKIINDEENNENFNNECFNIIGRKILEGYNVLINIAYQEDKKLKNRLKEQELEKWNKINQVNHILEENIILSQKDLQALVESVFSFLTKKFEKIKGIDEINKLQDGYSNHEITSQIYSNNPNEENFNNFDKKKEELNKYIKYFNEFSEKIIIDEEKEENFNNECFNIIGRKILEGYNVLINLSHHEIVDKNETLTKKLKNSNINPSLVLNKWNKINQINHNIEKEIILSPIELQMHVEYVFSFLTKNFEKIEGIDKIQNKFSYSLKEEEWIDDLEDKKFNNYKAFVTKVFSYSDINLNEITHASKNFKQKEKHYIFLSNDLNPLHKHNYYEISAKKQYLKVKGDKKNISRYLLTSAKMIPIINKRNSFNLDKDVILWKLNLIDTFQMSPINCFLFYKKNNNYELNEKCLEFKKTLIKFLNELYKKEKNVEQILFNTLYLKHERKEIFEKNEDLNRTPWKYEFWTKSPKGEKSSFSLGEKEIIFDLIKQIDNFPFDKKPFFAKKNQEFFEKNLEKKTYFFKKPLNKNIKDEFPENYMFYSDHNEKQIIELNYNNEKYWTTHFFNDLKEETDKFLETIKNINIVLEDKWKKHISKEEFLDKKQKEALSRSLINPFIIIYGPPGTGKTTIVSKILKILDEENESIIFLATTHRASKIPEIMDSYNNLTSSTIQKICSNINSNKNKPYKDIILDKYENIIIDEFSTIDDEQLLTLFSYFNENPKTRIIFVGDKNQISPINSFGFFKNYILEKAKKVNERNTFCLEKNHRQENNKGNLKNLIKEYLKNNKVNIKNNRFIEYYDSIEKYFNLLEEHKEYDIFLTPINYGLYGKNNINEVLTNKSNDSFEIGDEVIVVEDLTEIDEWLYTSKIMIITEYEELENDLVKISFKNENNKSIVKNNSKESFNKVNKDDVTLKEYDFEYDEGRLIFKQKEKNIDFPFAKSKCVTIHSSQGSTYDDVVFIIPPNYNVAPDLFYTAISRPKNNLKIFLYTKDSNKLIDNN